MKKVTRGFLISVIKIRKAMSADVGMLKGRRRGVAVYDPKCHSGGRNNHGTEAI